MNFLRHDPRVTLYPRLRWHAGILMTLKNVISARYSSLRRDR